MRVFLCALVMLLSSSAAMAIPEPLMPSSGMIEDWYFERGDNWVRFAINGGYPFYLNMDTGEGDMFGDAVIEDTPLGLRAFTGGEEAFVLSLDDGWFFVQYGSDEGYIDGCFDFYERQALQCADFVRWWAEVATIPLPATAALLVLGLTPLAAQHRNRHTNRR